jgi:hypothetical protein
VIARVDVVDDLAALVTQPAMVLEPRRPLHGAHATGLGRASGAPRSAPDGLSSLEDRMAFGLCESPTGWDHFPAAGPTVAGGYSPGGPAGRLAASHLRGPRSMTTQLDHLLSSVAPANHICAGGARAIRSRRRVPT